MLRRSGRELGLSILETARPARARRLTSPPSAGAGEMLCRGGCRHPPAAGRVAYAVHPVVQKGSNHGGSIGGRGCVKPDEVRLLAETEESFWWHRGRQRIVRRLLNRFVAPDARVLDIGCGPGGTTLAYASGRAVLGTDSSPESLRWARQRGLTVAAMDASRLVPRCQRRGNRRRLQVVCTHMNIVIAPSS